MTVSSSKQRNNGASRLYWWICFWQLLSILPSPTTAAASPRRALPEKVIVGYAKDCNYQVDLAVRQGVNVVIWTFWNWPQSAVARTTGLRDEPLSHLPLDCIEKKMKALDNAGYTDVVHMISVGGWNGPHFPSAVIENGTTLLMEYFQASTNNILHGIDIDLEGNDDLQSPWNFMSQEELNFVGEFIQTAKQDFGYAISLAPAQSYLDIHTIEFSHYLNTTDQNRTWHSDFHFFGRNLYADWLHRVGEDSIDLVMVQFYESYSRAAMAITQNYVTPENYLQQYVWDLHQPKEGSGFYVKFDEEKDADPVFVSLPISKLVWGFANAWAIHPEQNETRHIYFDPIMINAAYQNLWDSMLEPRGFMFWSIHTEGDKGIYFAGELNEILHIRNGSNGLAATRHKALDHLAEESTSET